MVERDTLREQRWQSPPSEDRPAIRPVLLTLLGEFVFPDGRPVWTRTFLAALDALGYAEGAARQALTRSAAAGWLEQERVGRNTRLALTAEMKRLLKQGSRRIYGFGLAERAWNGEWLLLQVTVPESRRDLRHRLQTRLAWAGFGPLGQGVWITPDPTREVEAAATLEELGLFPGTLSFVARSGAIGDPRVLVARAWDLDDLAGRYEDFLARFKSRRPATPEDCFVVLTELVHAWRAFPFLDPELPEALYGGGWVGRRAISRFHELRDRWRPGALRFWRELSSDAEGQASRDSRTWRSRRIGAHPRTPMSRPNAIALSSGLLLCATAALGAAAPPTIESWPLCELIGPGAQRPGVYGTDLGFTFRHPYRDASGAVDERIVFLFGDTWPTFDSPCTEPPWTNDDTMATLRVADLPEYAPGPPGTGTSAPRCPVLDFAVPDPLHDRPLRVVHEGRDLDMSPNRTPLAGWSDGRRPYGLFTSAEIATCMSDGDCGAGQSCLRGELGRCTVDPCPAGQQCPRDPRIDEVLSPPVCRLDRNDCAAPFSPRRRCAADPDARGMCTDATGSMWVTGSAAHPDDPDRRLLATMWVYVAVEDEQRPNVWQSVARFSTAKFVNPAARTIAAFDPADPSRNDYRHGYDTLLVWGKPTFRGAEGAQALTYLLYNKLEPTTAGGAMRWSPRYFAGYGDDGRPRWSDRESDAAALYPSDFDVVNQISMSWVEPLGAWVMLYGGDDTDGSATPTPRVHAEPAPGAVHLRWADHPWGAVTRDASGGAWSAPLPVLRPTDTPGWLACSAKGVPAGCAEGDRVRPIDFFRARMTDIDCHAGNNSFDRGIFYSAHVIDELTRSVPPSKPGARAAEVVWDISTWNPYAVMLVKSRIEIAP